MQKRRRLAEELRRCGGVVSDGRGVHDEMVRSGLERDVFLGSLIVEMYGSCGAVEEARSCFARLQPGNSDQYTWNHLITAYARQGQGKEAVQLFDEMQQEGMVPNQFIVPSIFSACADQAGLGYGKKMHARVMGSELQVDVVVGNAIVNMYGKCDSLEDAQRMFDTMSERNTFSWTAIIAGHAQHGQGKKALQLFDQMQKEGILPNNVTFASILCACANEAALAVGNCMHSRITAIGFQSDVTVANALVNMYGKCGSLGDAQKSFDKMAIRNSPSWNALITAYVENVQGMPVFQLFQQMQQEATLPDRVTFISVFSACASQTTITEAKRLHACVIHNGCRFDIVVKNALLNAYAKCSTLENTWMVFLEIPEPDAVSWTALISAAAQHGQVKLAVQLFDEMQKGGVMANEVTILSILFGCSHVGMMDEGYYWFSSINYIHSFTPLVDHYNCIIDLLARAGQLSEAKELISTMPYQPTLVSWMALLGASKNQDDVEYGEHAGYHVFEF